MHVAVTYLLLSAGCRHKLVATWQWVSYLPPLSSLAILTLTPFPLALPLPRPLPHHLLSPSLITYLFLVNNQVKPVHSLLRTARHTFSGSGYRNELGHYSGSIEVSQNKFNPGLYGIHVNDNFLIKPLGKWFSTTSTNQFSSKQG